MSKTLGRLATFYDVEVDEYFERAFQIEKFPTIIMVKKNKYYEYDQPRYVENMREFLDKNYKDTQNYSIPGELGLATNLWYFALDVVD